jgi:DNA-directed RNA polymerase specialized sigma24 family protein
MQYPPHGDERELFQLPNRKLVNVIRRRFRLSEEEARDVVQFAWLKFVEKQPARTNVFGWLSTTAKHEVYARSRRAKRERAAEQIPEQSHDPDLPA